MKYQRVPMPPDNLEHTVTRYNSFVDSGMDEDFGKPKPLYKIATPPFHAAWATPVIHDTRMGLRINAHCQVMDMNGHVIPGLYCGGEFGRRVQPARPGPRHLPGLHRRASRGVGITTDSTAAVVARTPLVRLGCGGHIGTQHERSVRQQRPGQARQTPRRADRNRLLRQGHRGPGGPGAGAPPPRHVYRRHRRNRPAPPGRRDPRQRHGRGGGRPRQLHRGGAGARQLADGARQRPRHPGRSAPEIQTAQRPGGDPDDAALGRQIRRQGLCDLGRPARRRQLGGQRAVRGDGGGGRARPRPVEAKLRPRQADHEADQCRPGAQPPRHHDPLQAGHHDLRPGAVQPGAALPAVPLQGLSVPRRGNPLGLRPVPAEGCQGRHPGRGGAALPRRPARQPGSRYRRARHACCR